MKYKSFIILCIVLVIPLISVTCYASNDSFEFEYVEQSNSMNYFDSLELKAIDNPKFDGNFSCFGVSENGNFALSYKRNHDCYILIYDASGEFIVGFSFFDYGSFCIELFDDTFVIYTFRGSLAYTVTYGGACVSVKRILDTTHNNEYWRKLESRRRIVGENEYVAEALWFNSDVFSGGTYSKLTKVSPNGETILYEASGIGHFRTVAPAIVTAVLVLAVCPTVCVIIIFKVIKRRNKAKSE